MEPESRASKVVLLLAFLAVLITPALALDGWEYYREVTITNNVAQTLTDYQVNFTLDTASLIAQGKMRSDCGDLRVTQSDEQTLLPYWIEPTTCNTNNTRIWTKVPSISASSSVTIYMWYGNPQATSAMNGSAVFLLYNDWESGTLEGWNILSGGGTGSASVVLLDGRYQLKLHAPSTFNRVQANKAFNSSTAGYMIETVFKTGSSVGDGIVLGFSDGSMISASCDQPKNAYYYAVARDINTNDYIERYSWGVGTPLASRSNTLSANTYYRVGFSWYGNTLTAFFNDAPVLSVIDTTFSSFTYVFISADLNDKYFDWLFVRKFVSPEPNISIGATELIPKLQIPDAVRVKVQYLDTGAISYYSIPITINLKRDQVYNVSASLSISGVNPSYGANITVELLSKVTLVNMSYNNSSVSYTYLGQNTSNSRVYSVYNFTTTANGTLVVNGTYANRAWDTVVKIDKKAEPITNLTAVLGENVEIVLPARGNITLPSGVVLANVTSFNFNTRGFGVGDLLLTLRIDVPESDDYGLLTIYINTVYANRTVTVLDKDGEIVSGVGIYAYNIDTNKTTPASAIEAGNNSIQIFFRDMKLAETPAFYVNHTNVSDSLTVSVLSKLLPTDYKNANKRIYAQKDFNITVLDAKVSRFAINLTEPSYVYVDFARNFSVPQLILNNCSLISYTFPYVKLYCSGNATVVEGYILTLQVKDALGRAIDIVFALDNESLSSNRGIATITKPVGNYSLRLPAESFGFKLKTNATYSITLENDTSITAVYKVPVKIESREVRIEKRYPFPYPFLPFGTQETGNVGSVAKFKLEGSVIDYFGAPVPNRNVIIEIKAVGGATTYANTTTDSSGNFRIQADFATNTTYMITYTLPEDDIYVGTSSVKTLAFEAPTPSPPAPSPITIPTTAMLAIAILVLIAIVAVAKSARRKTAEHMLRDMSEFRFFRRVR
jgi:hypothetical protein